MVTSCVGDDPEKVDSNNAEGGAAPAGQAGGPCINGQCLTGLVCVNERCAPVVVLEGGPPNPDRGGTDGVDGGDAAAPCTMQKNDPSDTFYIRCGSSGRCDAGTGNGGCCIGGNGSTSCTIANGCNVGGSKLFRCLTSSHCSAGMSCCGFFTKFNADMCPAVDPTTMGSVCFGGPCQGNELRLCEHTDPNGCNVGERCHPFRLTEPNMTMGVCIGPQTVIPNQ